MKNSDPKTKHPRTSSRNALMNTAYSLFMEHGYESTSVQMIIDRVGIAKGTFYHHFSSKEELLNEITLVKTETALESVKAAIEHGEMNAVEKLNSFYSQFGIWKASNKELMLTAARTLYSEKNYRLRRKLQTRSQEMILPYYTTIIEQGLREGLFQTPYPEFTARLIFPLSFSLSDEIIDLFIRIDEDEKSAQKITILLEQFQWSIERLLGAEEGSLQLFTPELVNSFRTGGSND